MSEMRTDYSDIHFKDNGKLKLLIIVGTRPEIIRLAAVINKCRKYFDVILAIPDRIMIILSTEFSLRISRSTILKCI